MIKGTGIVVVSTVFIFSTAFAQMAPAKIGDTSKGKALVNDKGMTLYVF
jgi:predicted lipoprotein with Yx(FWY)xxD motif